MNRTICVILLMGFTATLFAQPPFFGYQRNRVAPSPTSRPPAAPAATRSSSASGSGSRRPATTPSARTTGEVISRQAVISVSGAYSLNSNITVDDSASTGAIIITAPDVTLNLNGHSVRNRIGEHPEACGIAVFADRVTVRDGTISGFNFTNQCAVILGAGVHDFRLEKLRISGCETGIVINPDNNETRPNRGGVVEDCSISGAAVGLLSFYAVGTIIRNNIISSCAVRQGNEGEGSGALLRGKSYLIEGCNFSGNSHGLRLEADFSTIRETILSANRNTGAYITGTGAVLDGVQLSGNGLIGAVVASSQVVFRKCSIQANGASGLVLDKAEEESAESTSILDCTISGNGNEGVVSKGLGNSVIDRCHITGNAGTGLLLAAGDVYRQCILHGKGAAVQGGVDGGGNHIQP